MKQTIATRTEWRTHPANKWAFRNVEAFIPTATIANDPAQISPLQLAATRWKPNLAYRGLFGLTSTDALVVLVDGELRYEYYAHGNGPETPHILMSGSKAVTGLLLALLANEGLIDYQAPIAHYLPEVAHTRYAGASIRELIDMRAGTVLDDNEQRAYDLATNWEPAQTTPKTAHLKAFFQNLSDAPVTHGGAFRYISANTDLLGWAIERATGQTIATLLSERLWKPIGAQSRAYVTVDADGLARCAGGICATARDFARLGQLFLTQGKSGARQAIPAAVIDDICRNADKAAWAGGEWGRLFGFISKDMGCRSGWYVVGDGPRYLFAMGIHGQNLFIDLENRVVVVKFSSWKKASDPVAFVATHKVFSRLRDMRR